MAMMLWMWLALAGVFLVFAIGRTGGYGALTLAYFLAISLFHVPGAMAYLDPLLAIGDIEATEIGFHITLIGLASYTVGAVVMRWFGGRVGLRYQPQLASPRTINQLGRRMLGIGIFAYFVILPASQFLPSFTAAVSAVSTLLIIGLWMRLYSAVTARNFGGIVRTFAILPLLPLATLVTAGFIGYGVYWVLSVIAFYYTIVRSRIWFYVLTPIVIFLGLSLFVTYMGERNNIREAVWEEKAGLEERIDRVAALVTRFRLLDLSDAEQMTALNGRLNQNYFVGMGARRYEQGSIELKYGGTVPFWGFIPRALWPEKPAISGGSAIIADFTGLQFSYGTTFGAGQVLEFYANFATPGVVFGFFGLGMLLMWLDRKIMLAFVSGNLRNLLIYGMPGLVLLKAEGNLLEIIVAVIGAAVSSRVIVLLESKRIARAEALARAQALAKPPPLVARR